MRLLVYIIIMLCVSGCNHGTSESHSGNPVSSLHSDKSVRRPPSESLQAQGADYVASPPKRLDTGRQVESPIDLRAIPHGWKSVVANAARRVELPPQRRVFAVVEEAAHDGLRQEMVFVLYEDGPDAAHRIGTYKVGRSGDAYRLNEMADGDKDMWVLLPIPPS